jgi:protein-(glutamine-N5) methyltransferase, release factor-specific
MSARIADLLNRSNLPRLEMRILLGHVLDKDAAWLLTHDHEILTPAQQQTYQNLVQRRVNGEPIAYLVGHKEFWGMQIAVSSAVLIPRPETETLVEAALTYLSAAKKQHVLDLGTGSGAIALALAMERKNIDVDAVDASLDALAIAQKNMDAILGDDQRRVTLIHSHWFKQLPREKKYDLIVSNPPYVADNDVHLSEGDVRFEPITALRSGADGLDDIRVIVRIAPLHLSLGGALFLEHGYDQAHAVAALLKTYGFRDIKTTCDLAGIERVTGGVYSDVRKD